MSPKHTDPLTSKTMELLLKRTYFRDHFVMGFLQVNKEYVCDTLEPHAIDWSVEKKKAGVTAIPEGKYRIQLAYSPTFKRRMPYLMAVPEFSGIMIHTGNVATKPDGKAGNSRGCILVGCFAGEGVLEQSRIHFNLLMEKLERADEAEEEIWITIRSPREWTYRK